MGSQTVRAVLGLLSPCLASACGNPLNPTVSAISTQVDAPDLSLQGVAFARLSEGQVVARGTAERLDYQRAGGRVVASHGAGVVYPLPGTSLAQFGTVRFFANDVDGEVPNRRGTASGNVRMETTRGDSATTERIECEGDLLRSNVPVAAKGPGYRVEANGLLAKTDGSSIKLTQGVKGQLDVEGRR